MAQPWKSFNLVEHACTCLNIAACDGALMVFGLWKTTCLDVSLFLFCFFISQKPAILTGVGRLYQLYISWTTSCLFPVWVQKKKVSPTPACITGLLFLFFFSVLLPHSAWTDSREPTMVLGAQEAFADHVSWGRRKSRDLAISRGDEESWENRTARVSTAMLDPSVRDATKYKNVF